MRQYIPYDRAIKAITELRDSLRLQRQYAAASEAETTRLDIIGMERFEVDQEDMQPVSAKETYAAMAVVPFFGGCKLGHEVAVCMSCGNRFRPGDVYCSFCGRRLVSRGGDQK